MNQPVDGPRLYTSFADCIVKVTEKRAALGEVREELEALKAPPSIGGGQHTRTLTTLFPFFLLLALGGLWRRACGGQVVRAQGVASLWAGFVPMWSRVAPTATLQLLLYEKMMVLTGGKAI
jgi:hypothetical protein